MSSLDMFEESPVLEAGGGGSNSEAAGSLPEHEEAVGSVLTDRTNTIHIDQVRFYILYFLGGIIIFFVLYSTLLHLPSPPDSTVPTDAGIESRTVATGALAVRRSYH
jgi:hypothetical protein